MNLPKNKFICPACIGNGYRRIFKDSSSNLRVVIDCKVLASGSSIAISQNAYVKAYNGVDVLTIMQTDKDIKRHVYERIKRD